MGRVRTNNIRQSIRKYERKPQQRVSDKPFARFDFLDGSHPWQELVTEGYILYPVRKLNEGKVVYFNFQLAKEMGLLPRDHKHKLTKKLEKILLDTFSLRIVNEYDDEHNITYHPRVMKPKKYMATRYLQLQHPNKTGKTSGDGRCIWNGCIDFNGTLWDVSSRGTGVTALAPGVVEAGKPLESGNTDFGYGCGLADLDELIGAAISAEVFHNSGINTERVLCVIDLGKGAGIGVRAGKNLLRPAHLFMHLKQGNLDALRRSTDYLIERQYKNNEWSFHIASPRRYDQLLEEICETFAQFTAQLDRDYIFTWMDWDGDNILINGGIIDYGSIRLLGLRHDQYRYDDADRFSTNLNQQVAKARQIVQVFGQLVDFLKTGTKKPIGEFANNPILKKFDNHFSYYQKDLFLQQIGLCRKDRELLLASKHAQIQDLYQDYFALETTKTNRRTMKVADGINRPAILNMRKGLRYLAEQLAEADHAKLNISEKTFFKEILAESAKGADRKPSANLNKRIRLFLDGYLSLMKDFTNKNQLQAISRRSYEANRPDRLTGDGLLHVVDKMMSVWKHGRAEPDLMQKAIENIITEQASPTSQSDDRKSPRLHTSRRLFELTNTLLTLVDGHKESI